VFFEIFFWASYSPLRIFRWWTGCFLSLSHFYLPSYRTSYRTYNSSYCSYPPREAAEGRPPWHSCRRRRRRRGLASQSPVCGVIRSRRGIPCRVVSDAADAAVPVVLRIRRVVSVHAADAAVPVDGILCVAL
jgi:hypothetical protein